MLLVNPVECVKGNMITQHVFTYTVWKS